MILFSLEGMNMVTAGEKLHNEDTALVSACGEDEDEDARLNPVQMWKLGCNSSAPASQIPYLLQKVE